MKKKREKANAPFNKKQKMGLNMNVSGYERDRGMGRAGVAKPGTAWNLRFLLRSFRPPISSYEEKNPSGGCESRGPGDMIYGLEGLKSESCSRMMW